MRRVVVPLERLPRPPSREVLLNRTATAGVAGLCTAPALTSGTFRANVTEHLDRLRASSVLANLSWDARRSASNS